MSHQPIIQKSLHFPAIIARFPPFLVKFPAILYWLPTPWAPFLSDARPDVQSLTGYKSRGGAFGAVLLAVAAAQRAASRPRQPLLNGRVPGVRPRLFHAGATRPLPVCGPRKEGRDGRRCGGGGRRRAARRRQRLERAAAVLVIVVENCC
jgi:hypothetical protein